MTSKTSQIIIVVILIVLAFVGYRLYFVPTDTGSSTLAAEKNTQLSAQGNELYLSLKKLSAVSLDSSIFANPIFLSLVDYTVTIQDQAVGRPNPFAPIGSDGSFNSSISSTTVNNVSQPRVR